MTKRRLNAGLTQLDLLIALAVMGMITVALGSAIGFNRLSIEAFRIFARHTDELVARRQLKAFAASIPTNSDGEDQNPTFIGDTQSLRFFAIVEDDTFWAGSLAEFFVAVESNGTTNALVMSGRGRHPQREELLEKEWVLARSVTSFKISYFGYSREGMATEWHVSWADETGFPKLVKLEWETIPDGPAPILTLQPGKSDAQSLISASSLLPPR